LAAQRSVESASRSGAASNQNAQGGELFFEIANVLRIALGPDAGQAGHAECHCLHSEPQGPGPGPAL